MYERVRVSMLREILVVESERSKGTPGMSPKRFNARVRTYIIYDTLCCPQKSTETLGGQRGTSGESRVTVRYYYFSE